MDAAVQKVIEQAREFVETSFPGEYEVYDITFKPANRRWVLEVKIDREEGVTVKDCEIVSRSLEQYLDENDLIHRQYVLDVSSPGAERILKRPVDFQRHVGRLIRWSLTREEGEGAGEGSEVIRGRLQEFTGERVIVQVEKQLREIPLNLIREARAILEFPAKPKRG